VVRAMCRWLVLCALGALVGCGPGRLIREGDEHLLAQRPAAAERSYQAALDRHPRLAEDAEFAAKLARARGLALLQAGRKLAEAKQWDAAIGRFGQAVAADPSLEEARQALGGARRQGAKAHHEKALKLADEGKLNDAIAELRHALKLDPENLDVRDALQSVEQRKRDNLSKAQRLHTQALALAGERRWGKAADALAAAIAANPNHLPARVLAARVRGRLAAAAAARAEGGRLLADRRLEQARDAYKAALAVWPVDDEANRGLQAALAQRQQAGTRYREATELAGGNRWDEAAAAAAASLQLFPYHREAEALLDRARRRAAAAHCQAASELLAKGKLAEAERACLRALDHVPDLAAAKAALARADVVRGDEAAKHGLWGSARLWYGAAEAHLAGPPQSQKLRAAQARVLARVRAGLSATVGHAAGVAAAASASLRAAVLRQLADRCPDVLALVEPAAQPLYAATAQLVTLTVGDTLTSNERRTHHYTIAREVPNPDIPRLEHLLTGARHDLAHLRREYRRRCPLCRGTGRIPCQRCKGTGTVRDGDGRKPCPACAGRGWAKCSRCRGTGRDTTVSRHDVRRKEREVDELEHALVAAPHTVTEHVPAQWQYTLKRYRRKGVVEVVLHVGSPATRAVLHTDRIQRHVIHYDQAIENANPGIGLRADPLQLPSAQSIGSTLLDAAAREAATQVLAACLRTREAELGAAAESLRRSGKAPEALEALVDQARVRQASDPRRAADMLRRLQQARRTHPTPRRALGVQVQPLLTADLPRRLGLQGAASVVLHAVEPRSPAARAGLRPGDVVLRLDGRPVGTPAAFAAAEAASGAVAKLQVVRAGRQVVAFAR